MLVKLPFLRNTTVLAVLFLCVVSFVNITLPVSVGVPLARSASLGNESFNSSPSHAFMSVDSILYDDVLPQTPSVMHDALAEGFGQSTYVEISPDMRDFVRRFSLPARGINWGVLHSHNAVDIAGACGSGVYAVSAGQVVDVREGFSHGYGNYVDIDHGSGVITRYAHAEKILVKPLQMVAAGDMVAHMGSTGTSTGCHVHFEVLGPPTAINPFAR